MRTRPGPERITAFAVVLALLGAAGLCDGQNATSNSTDTASTVIIANSFLNTSPSPIILPANWTIQSSPGKTFSWDVSFSSAAFSMPEPGSQLLVTNIHMLNVKLDVGAFLVLPMFGVNSSSSSSVHLSSVLLLTDCYTLFMYQSRHDLASMQVVSSRGFLFVSSYDDSRVTARNVNITCVMPPIVPAVAAYAALVANSSLVGTNVTDFVGVLGPGALVIPVSTDLQLINALAYIERYGSSDDVSNVILTANVSLMLDKWPSGGLVLAAAGNVTIWGGSRAVVLDFQGQNRWFILAAGSGLTLRSLTLVNLDQARGVGLPGSLVTLFAYPIWAISFNRRHVQLFLLDVVVGVSKDEFSYLTLWTIFATSSISSKAPEYHALTQDVSALELESSPTKKDPNLIAFKRFAMAGLDASDVGFSVLKGRDPITPVANISMPTFYESLNFASTTVVAIYSYQDLLAAFTQVTSAPEFQPYTTNLLIYGDITMDPATWPADGFPVNQSIVLYGMVTAPPRYVNFRHVPGLVSITDCTADTLAPPHSNASLTLRNLELLNLANTSDAGYGVAALSSGGQNTLMLPFISTASHCQDVSLNMSNVIVVIPYSEFKSLASETPVGPLNTSYVSPILDSQGVQPTSSWIYFNEVEMATWTGFAVNITFVPRRPNIQLTYYDNAVDAPIPEDYPNAPNMPAGPYPIAKSMQAWEITIIAAASVVAALSAVFLVTVALRWRRNSATATDAVAKGADAEAGFPHSPKADVAWDKVAQSMSADVDLTATTSSTVRRASLASNNYPLGDSARAAAAAAGAPATAAARDGQQLEDPSAAEAGDAEGGLKARKLSGAVVAGGVTAELLARWAPAMPGSAAHGGSGGGTTPVPLVELNSVLHQLTREMDDEHLVILDVLGQGGYGTVYKALWKSLTVAVKTITFQDRMCGGEKAQHRAIMEAAISSSLAHANIVTTYSYDIKPLSVQSGPDGGRLVITQQHTSDWKMYIIQEFCDAGSLRGALLDRRLYWDAFRQAPKMEQVLETAIDVARGLSHLHGKNILHGDLSPSNILLKRDSGAKFDTVAKLCDFGLSVKMAADQSHISNMHRGTPFYTGPEVLQAGNYTKAADIFSFGVILWELYNGRVCYRMHPERDVCVYYEDFPCFSDRCPVAFADLTLRCIASDPSLRPSIAEVLACLDSMREQQRSGQQLLTIGQDNLLFGLSLESPDKQRHMFSNGDGGLGDHPYGPLSGVSSGQMYGRPAPPSVLSSGEQYAGGTVGYPAQSGQHFARPAPSVVSSGQQYALTDGGTLEVQAVQSPRLQYDHHSQGEALGGRRRQEPHQHTWQLPMTTTVKGAKGGDTSASAFRSNSGLSDSSSGSASLESGGNSRLFRGDSRGVDGEEDRAECLLRPERSASSSLSAAMPAAVARVALCTWFPSPNHLPLAPPPRPTIDPVGVASVGAEAPGAPPAALTQQGGGLMADPSAFVADFPHSRPPPPPPLSEVDQASPALAVTPTPPVVEMQLDMPLPSVGCVGGAAALPSGAAATAAATALSDPPVPLLMSASGVSVPQAAIAAAAAAAMAVADAMVMRDGRQGWH